MMCGRAYTPAMEANRHSFHSLEHARAPFCPRPSYLQTPTQVAGNDRAGGSHHHRPCAASQVQGWAPGSVLAWRV